MSNEQRAENMDISENKSSLTIPGLDVKHGLYMSGGDPRNYRQVLSIFCKDAENRLSLLQSISENDDLNLFITQVHALKSAAASIGVAEISSLALELETAGKSRDLVLINEKLPVFNKMLFDIIKAIRGALESELEVDSLGTELFLIANSSLLSEFISALESKNGNEISRILQDLEDAALVQPLDSETKDFMEQISNEIMMAEYDNAKKIIMNFITDSESGSVRSI
jgi:HPt (histidine-containing phosphotransfer) domain-containing protein